MQRMTIISWWVFSIEKRKREFKNSKNCVPQNGDPDTSKDIYIYIHTHTYTFLLASFTLDFKSHQKESIWKGKQCTFLQITSIEMGNLFSRWKQDNACYIFLIAGLSEVFCVGHASRSQLHLQSASAISV